MIRRALPPALALLAFAAPAFAQSVNTGPGCAAGITCSTGTVTGQAANSFELNNVSASSTVPTVIPDKADSTTGVGNGGSTGQVGVTIAGVLKWKVDGSGNLLALPDSTGDIGGSASNRPRDVNAGRNISAGNQITSPNMKTAPSLISQLNTCNSGNDGDHGFVTDSNQTMAAGVGTPVATGGSNHVPVYCDGSGTPTWKIG